MVGRVRFNATVLKTVEHRNMFRGFKSYTIRHINRGLAQFGSASDLGSEGRVFKSHNPDQFGSVAQRLEPCAHNTLVVGSIPT